MIVIGEKKGEKEEEREGREKNEVRRRRKRERSSLDNFVVWGERLNRRPRS